MGPLSFFYTLQLKHSCSENIWDLGEILSKIQEICIALSDVSKKNQRSIIQSAKADRVPVELRFSRKAVVSLPELLAEAFA